MGATKLTAARVRALIPARAKDSHKGDYGRVLVVAGSAGMTGAAMLCVHGALRAGAGLVTAAVPASQQPVVAAHMRAEAMSLPLPEKASGLDGRAAARKIVSFAGQGGATALVVGPGLGTGREVRVLVEGLLLSLDLPVVLDADAIRVLAGDHGVFARAKAQVVMTPHPGELGLFSGVPVGDVQRRREEAATAAARGTGAVCVLKGHRTVVTDGERVFVNPTGNPGMATGGVGDVLAGMIGALAAQVRPPSPLNAALCGVYLHGLAGDIAVRAKTDMGLLAGDVAEAVPEAVRVIRRRVQRKG